MSAKSWFSKPDTYEASELLLKAVTEYKKAICFDEAAKAYLKLGAINLKKDPFSAGKYYEDSGVAGLENIRRRYPDYLNPTDNKKAIVRDKILAQDAYALSADAYKKDKNNIARAAYSLSKGGQIIFTDKGLAMLKESYEIYDAQDMPHEAVECLRHIIRALVQQKKFKDALTYLKTMTQVCMPDEDSPRDKQMAHMSRIPLSVIIIHLFLNDPDSAFNELTEFEDIVENFDEYGNGNTCYSLISAYNSGNIDKFAQLTTKDPSILMLDREIINLAQSIKVPENGVDQDSLL